MSLLCTALVAFSALAAAGEAPAPRRLGYVAIPDLRGTLARVEAAAALLAPGSLPPGALAFGLGAQLGDPGLAALGKGPVVAVLTAGATPAALPGVTLFVPVADPAPYEKALGSKAWRVKRGQGFVVASAAAPAPDEEYMRIVSEAGTADLRVWLGAVDVLEAYGPTIRAATDAFAAGLAARPPEGKSPAGASSASVGRILQLEVKALLLLLEQTESLVSDVTLQPDAVLSESVVTTRPGSTLAKLAAQPPAGPHAAAALLSPGSFMAATYQVDMPRVSGLMADLLRQAGADPQMSALAAPELLSLLEHSGRAFTGAAAVGMGAGKGGAPLVSEMVAAVRDEAAAMAVMEKTVALVAPGSAWSGLYAELGMGLSLSLQKNVRRHAGVPVHRVKMTLDAKGLPAEQQKQFAIFVRDTEFAVTRGYLFSAQEAGALDALLDRAAAAPPTRTPTLRAERAFGAGAQIYVDYDVLGLLRAFSAALPPVPGTPNPFAGLPAMEGEPLMYAIRLADDRIRMVSKAPLRPFVALVESVQKAEREKKVTPGQTPKP
jgi:hypothetical protein